MKNIDIKQLDDIGIWEAFVQEHASHSLFQSYFWGKVIEHSGKLWRVGIYKEKNLVGIAQINKTVAKRGMFLHVRHGPVFSKWDKEVFAAFFDWIKKLATEEGAWFIRISPLIEGSLENKKFLSSFGFRSAAMHAMDGEYCWVLDLDKNEEELLVGMRKTTRYLVRQGAKQKIHIENSTDINAFLNLYETTSQRHGFVPHKEVKREFEIFAKEDKALLLLGFFEKKLYAGALIIFYGNQAIYRHGASIPTKAPVSYLLQWEAIKHAKRRGMKRYNFWGIAPEDKHKHPWRGITLFKKGFGGYIASYLHAHDFPLSPRYIITFVVESIRRIKKGY